MSLYNSAKRLVPLPLKESFHKHKSVPRDVTARVTTRLNGRPAVPPSKLIYLVAGHRSASAFLAGGRSASEAIRAALARNGLRMEQFNNVLDFGCGVGRIIRHWNGNERPALHGTDYNPDLIEWCRKNLTSSEFRVNTLSGALPYDGETFDFIYSFSVFTHLREPLQFHWIDELSRVLKPGGYIYLTTHGEQYLPVLNSSEQEQFRKGELVVREEEQSGSNLCAVFHPPSYVRDTLARKLEVADFIACGAHGDSMHDVHLLRKP
ncbi:MAG TPA: class I SAM-dependent methyltransferase [Pyrinomonadaceae bacterium]|nr:class I SAM-dependent methyltransferase [Pyrinomonadaceae bacterium]